MEVTYIFHISTWIFFYVLKNSINRTDILLLIFHISTCRSSCHLYTCEGDLRVPSTFLHGIFPIQWKISNRRMLSVHSTSPHGIFSVCKKIHLEDRHPGMDFLHFHIQFIKSPLYKRSWPIYSIFLNGFFFFMLKNSTNRTVILLSIFHILL